MGTLVGKSRKEPSKRTLVFYISGHGFGHASRSVEVINALLAHDPDLRIIVRTMAPKWLFDLTVRSSQPIDYHPIETDTGVVQIDSLHLNVGQTVDRASDFMRTFDTRVTHEVAFLNDVRASIVVADIPPLGVAAAATAGVPAIALGNFTWDWIYAAYPDTDEVVRAIGNAYARADLALRLPMHGGFAAFPRVVDVPFIARRSARDPLETRTAMGFPLDKRLVLVSFGGYGLERLDLDRLGQLDGFVALVPANLMMTAEQLSNPSPIPLDEPAMYTAGFRYEDIVRSVEVVVTKPGYGIIAECLANDTALLHTSRGHFIEYDVLVAEMPRFLRTAYIDHSDLFAGNWTPYLDALLAQPRPPEDPAVNGADIASRLLLAMMQD